MDNAVEVKAVYSCVDHLAGSVHTMAEQWRKCCWGKKEMCMFWVDIGTCL